MRQLSAAGCVFGGLFLAILLWSSYTDIRYRRIKTVFLILVFSGACLLEGISMPSLAGHGSFLLNTAIGTVIAVFLWRLNIWAAGDSKFFIMSVSSILALGTAGVSAFAYRGVPQVFVLLCNALVSAFLFIFLVACLSMFRALINNIRTGGIRDRCAGIFSLLRRPEVAFSQLKSFFFYAAALVMIMAVTAYLFGTVGALKQYQLLVFVIILSFYSRVQQMLKSISFIYLLLGVLLLIIWLRLDMMVLFWRALKLYVLLGLVRGCINWFVRTREVNWIETQRLRSRMLIVQEEIAALPPEATPGLRFFSDGLTEEQACLLREYYSRTGRKAVKIYSTFPFVPFIALAVFYMYLTGGKLLDILSFIY